MFSLKHSFFLFFSRDPEMISITSAPEAPAPRIRILDTRSREVETVRIGDKLTFRIEIPEDSKCFTKIHFFFIYLKVSVSSNKTPIILIFSALWNFR